MGYYGPRHELRYPHIKGKIPEVIKPTVLERDEESRPPERRVPLESRGLQAGFVVKTPTPDTPQHAAARGATMFAVLATCAQFFPVDVAAMRKRQRENIATGDRYPGFRQTYGGVIVERNREVDEMGHEQWCKGTRTLMVERGLSRLFPGYNSFEADMPKQQKPALEPQTFERIEPVEESVAMAVFASAVKTYCQGADTAKALAYQRRFLAEAIRDHGEAAVRAAVEKQGAALDWKIKQEGARQWCERQRRNATDMGLSP